MAGMKDLPPTNKPVTLNGLHIYQLKDGKVTHAWAYRDGIELAAQVGMIPTAPPAASASAKPGATAALPARRLGQALIL